MDKLGEYAAMTGVGIVAMVVAIQLGLFGPNSRAWRNTLFGAMLGAVLALVVSLFHLVGDISPLLVAIVVLTGAISGASVALLGSYFIYLGRRSGN